MLFFKEEAVDECLHIVWIATPSITEFIWEGRDFKQLHKIEYNYYLNHKLLWHLFLEVEQSLKLAPKQRLVRSNSLTVQKYIGG